MHQVLPSNSCEISVGRPAEISKFVPGKENLPTVLVLRGGSVTIKTSDWVAMPAELSRRFRGIGNVIEQGTQVFYFGSRTVLDGESLCGLAGLFDPMHETKWELVQL
jgi:hypothetical protein